MLLLLHRHRNICNPHLILCALWLLAFTQACTYPCPILLFPLSAKHPCSVQCDRIYVNTLHLSIDSYTSFCFSFCGIRWWQISMVITHTASISQPRMGQRRRLCIAPHRWVQPLMLHCSPHPLLHCCLGELSKQRQKRRGCCYDIMTVSCGPKLYNQRSLAHKLF